MDLIDLFRHDTGYQSIAAGQPVFLAGDASGVMFVLIEGQADVLVGDNEVVESADIATQGLSIVSQVERG